MVKMLDENSLLTIDHIGVALARADMRWRQRFAAEMTARGFPWHAEARGHVLAHLGPSGRSQADIAEAMGISKQAVQQLLDQLTADGVVRRVPDPKDKRGRRVELTALGLRDFEERNKVKKAIEADYAQQLGTDRLDALKRMLAAIA